MDPKKLPPGKVPWEYIERKVEKELPPDVILGPAHGEDAALVKIHDEVWAVASDPITFVSAEAGKLAVIVNANDVAVRGAKPRFFTAVVLLAEEKAFKEELDTIFDQIHTTAKAMEIVLIGGHTEVTPGLEHSIIVGTMMGKVEGKPILTGGLRQGDWIGITKYAGLEGTSILLTDFEKECRSFFSREAFERAQSYFKSDWLSIVPEATLAASLEQVTALHDVTEGGVGEALYEMANASGRSIEVFEDQIPLLAETKELCQHMNLNPLGLIGSGALLMGCREEGKDLLERALVAQKIPIAWIGKASEISSSPTTGLPRFKRDEILKAYKKNKSLK